MLCIILFNLNGYSQGVAINSSGAEPDPSAMLDISAADKGILIPLFCARRERSQKALLIFSELRK